MTQFAIAIRCHPLIAFWDQMNFLTCGLDASAALFSASWNLTRKSSMLKLSLLFLRLYIAQHILWADEKSPGSAG